MAFCTITFADLFGTPDQIYFPVTSDASEIWIKIKEAEPWMKLKLSNFNNDDKKYQRVFATILAAQASQTKVYFGTLAGDYVYYITSKYDPTRP